MMIKRLRSLLALCLVFLTALSFAGTTAAADAPSPYYIYIDKSAFTLTIYAQDSTGQLQEYKTYTVAHGGDKTPTGTFQLGSRKRWVSTDSAYAQFGVAFKSRLYIRTPLYAKKDAATLDARYYQGDFGLGTATTGGSIAVVCEAARFIYDRCPEDTFVEIAEKGDWPHGKPAAVPSLLPALPGVDPTDTAALSSFEDAGAQEEATPDAAPAAEKTETEKDRKKTASEKKLPYSIYIEKGSYTMTIYALDDKNEYTDVYRTYRIAHGGNKTPTGSFKLGSRERWHNFSGDYAQYAIAYHSRLYLHGPLYEEKDPYTLIPKYYDGEKAIGMPTTAGCIRMVSEAARFIYNKCPKGTVVEIVNGSPRGTSSAHIPSRNGRTVDPTDPNV